MKLFFLFLLIGILSFAKSGKVRKSVKTIKVAVIDTGFDFDSNWKSKKSIMDEDGNILRKPKLCKEGHVDFTGKGLKDNYGHGTHVAGIIAKFAGDSDYCLVIMKYMDVPGGKNNDAMYNTISAINMAIASRVDIINYSGGGNVRSDLECIFIKRALDVGIKVVAAAGNESNNINSKPFYPAMCDDRVTAVQNVDDKGALVPSSNYTDNKKNSKELVSEKGLDVLSLLPDNMVGRMTGTSQAAPTRVGKMIKKGKIR
jgi:subtilisin family serine protease